MFAVQLPRRIPWKSWPLPKLMYLWCLAHRYVKSHHITSMDFPNYISYTILSLTCNLSLFPDGYSAWFQLMQPLALPTNTALVGHLKTILDHANRRFVDISKYLEGVLSLSRCWPRVESEFKRSLMYTWYLLTWHYCQILSVSQAVKFCFVLIQFS